MSTVTASNTRSVTAGGPSSSLQSALVWQPVIPQIKFPASTLKVIRASMMIAGHTANFKPSSVTFIDLQEETAKWTTLLVIKQPLSGHPPHTQRDIDAIENVQRRAARFVSIVDIQVHACNIIES